MFVLCSWGREVVRNLGRETDETLVLICSTHESAHVVKGLVACAGLGGGGRAWCCAGTSKPPAPMGYPAVVCRL